MSLVHSAREEIVLCMNPIPLEMALGSTETTLGQALQEREGAGVRVFVFVPADKSGQARQLRVGDYFLKEPGNNVHTVSYTASAWQQNQQCVVVDHHWELVLTSP